MKRLLMPATALSIEKVAFAILCCTLLMLFAAPTAAQELDQCSGLHGVPSALPVGSATGCGILITITGTTGNLVATITVPGNGNPYDGEDDWLVGIQNSSSVTVGAIRLSGPDAFGFDGDGPCSYAYEQSDGEDSADCFNGAVPYSDPGDYQGPNNTFTGVSPNYTTGTVHFITPIPPGGSTWFALEQEECDVPCPVIANVVSIGETQPLVFHQTNIFQFGPFTETSSGVWTETHTVDDLQLTPISALTGADYWTVLPIPVPAGQTGIGPFTIGGHTAFGSGEYGVEIPPAVISGPPSFITSFPAPNSLACVAYTDFSSMNNPMCVELERDCSGPDCESTLQWTGQMDYDIDANSLPFQLGEPVWGWAPGVPGPTTPTGPSEDPYNPVITDFSINALTSYTGATPVLEGDPPPSGDPPPPKGGGPIGGSVFVAEFSPSVSVSYPIAPGVTIGFPGFEVPTSNTNTPSCSPEAAEYLLFPSEKQQLIHGLPVNCLLKVAGVRVPWLLVWDYTTTTAPYTPITKLQLCPTVTGGTCSTPGVSPPWVNLSLVPTNAKCGSFMGQNPLSGGPLVSLAPAFPGQYEFSWLPVNNPVGCQVSVVMHFDTGTIVSPATWVYSY